MILACQSELVSIDVSIDGDAKAVLQNHIKHCEKVTPLTYIMELTIGIDN